MILGSKQQFIPKYLDGTKIHTIRKGYRWRKGMTIHYYEKGKAARHAEVYGRQGMHRRSGYRNEI